MKVKNITKIAEIASNTELWRGETDELTSTPKIQLVSFIMKEGEVISCVPKEEEDSMINEFFIDNSPRHSELVALKETDKAYIEGMEYAITQVCMFLSNINKSLPRFNIEGEDINIAWFLHNHPKIADALTDYIMDAFVDDMENVVKKILKSKDEFKDKIEKLPGSDADKSSPMSTKKDGDK